MTSDISLLLFPLFLKHTDLQPPWWGHCATGHAVVQDLVTLQDLVTSTALVQSPISKPPPQQRGPPFSRGGRKRPHNPVTSRLFPSGTPVQWERKAQAASSNFQPCQKDAEWSKSCPSCGWSQARGFSDV